jgi:uncharacterized protein with PQ loop repeat
MGRRPPSSGPVLPALRSTRTNPESSFFLVSPLVVLGALGTLVSTITIVPHVLRAWHTKRPGGSPLAWVMGATGSTIWFVYGIASGDLLVGAPGLVTIPCGLLLAVWSLRRDVDEESSVATPADAEAVYVPDEWLDEDLVSGDTREMPAVA